MADKIVLSENIEPQTIEVSLDEVERRAIVGDDPPAPIGPAARKVHAARMVLRQRIVGAELARKATERGDLSPFLGQQAEMALTEARERLRQAAGSAFADAIAVGQQLAAHRSRAVADDHRLSDDGRETRKARREAILDRLASLDDATRHAAVESDDAVAEAVVMAAGWQRRSLGLLPATVTAARDRLVQHRSPEAHAVWTEARQQLQALAREVTQASRLIGSEITEEEIIAAN